MKKLLPAVLIGGGITDVVTRVAPRKMRGPLGRRVVVDNRLGANSILGSEIAAEAPPVDNLFKAEK